MEILAFAGSPRRFCGGRAIRPAVALSLVMALGTCLTAESPERLFDEYRVKAAFLYNFAKFVEWPSESFQSPDTPFAICVLGRDPFGRSLEETVAGRAIDGRPLVVRHISSLRQLDGCQVLFIGSAENKRASPTLDEIKTFGVLTVGESDVAASGGVVINFELDAGKVRFAINVAAARKEKLRVSSRLLSLAVAITK